MIDASESPLQRELDLHPTPLVVLFFLEVILCTPNCSKRLGEALNVQCR